MGSEGSGGPLIIGDCCLIDDYLMAKVRLQSSLRQVASTLA